MATYDPDIISTWDWDPYYYGDIGVDMNPMYPTINFNDMPYTYGYTPIGDPNSLSSILGGLVPALGKIGAGLLGTTGSTAATPSMSYQPKYKTESQRDMIKQYQDLINQIKLYGSQPAIPPSLQAWLNTGLAPLLASYGMTPEDKYKQEFLTALRKTPFEEFSSVGDYYDMARNELEKISEGITVADVSPGYRGPEWEKALEDYIDTHTTLRSKTADTYMEQAKAEQLEKSKWLNMILNALNLAESEYGAEGQIDTMTKLLGAAMIPTTAQDERTKDMLSKLANALTGYSSGAQGISNMTIPGQTATTNPYMTALSALLGSAATQFATTGTTALTDLFGGIGNAISGIFS